MEKAPVLESLEFEHKMQVLERLESVYKDYGLEGLRFDMEVQLINLRGNVRVPGPDY